MAFPSNPTDGQFSDDNQYVYVDPPGVWRLLSSFNSSDIGTNLNISDELQQLREDINEQIDILDSYATRVQWDRHQTVSVSASGLVPIDISKGRFVHIPSTSGSWEPVFLNVPNDGVEIILSVNVSGNDHEMTLSNGVYKKGSTIPALGDWDTDDQMVFRIIKKSFVSPYIVEWLSEGDAPDVDPDPVTPPSVTAVYSTSIDGQNPTDLSGATLPSGNVVIIVGPDDPGVESYRLFINHTGAIPAEGEEGDSFVGTRSNPPFYLLGQGVFWDTNTDPTGNDRTDYDSNGATTLTVVPKLIDGVTPTETVFSFNTSNAPISGATPVPYHTSFQYKPGDTSALVDIPDGVDRVLVVRAYYANGAGTILDKLTFNGVDMIELPLGNRDVAPMASLGSYTAYLTEANLTTGQSTLSAVYESSLGAYSSIVYEIDVITNLASPSFDAVTLFENVDVASMAPTLTGVAANSILLCGVVHTDTASADPTIDLGVSNATVGQTLSPQLEVVSSYVADSGAAGDKTATFTATGRQISNIVSIEYATSSGGSGGPEPIIPGTPSITLSTPADSQINVTWPDTLNAVSYQLRWSQGANPIVPNGNVIAASSGHTIGGLIGSQSYAVQARAKSSTGHTSPWSSVAYIVTTGTVPPPPEWEGKFLTSSSPIDVSYVEGGRYEETGMFVSTWIRRRNISNQSDQVLTRLVTDSILDEVIARWDATKNKRPFIMQAGPRLIWTAGLGVLSLGNHNGKTSPQEAAAQVLDMGLTGSKSNTNNRIGVITEMANSFNRNYRGWNVWEITHLSIFHETNGPWSRTGYMGRDPAIIGNPGLVNATPADYGAEMAAALNKAGATGECADVHRLAIEHVMEICWEIQPNMIIGGTPANPDGESVPTDQPSTANSSEWVYDAWPRPSAGFACDFIYSTLYSREAGSMKHLGGDKTNPNNWTRKEGWLDTAEEYVKEHNCASGMLETGVGYAVPGVGTLPDDIRMPSDDANYAFWELLVNQELSDVSKWPQGHGAFNHWTKMRWMGKPPPMNGDWAGDGSYNLFEGLWGERAYKDYYYDKLPGMPGDGSFYPRTRQWYKDNY